MIFADGAITLYGSPFQGALANHYILIGSAPHKCGDTPPYNTRPNFCTGSIDPSRFIHNTKI